MKNKNNLIITSILVFVLLISSVSALNLQEARDWFNGKFGSAGITGNVIESNSNSNLVEDCIDTDGSDYTRAGYTSIYVKGDSYFASDFCTSSLTSSDVIDKGAYVTEFSCSGNSLNYNVIKCATGKQCYIGACVSSSVIPTNINRNDADKKYFEQAIVEFKNKLASSTDNDKPIVYLSLGYANQQLGFILLNSSLLSERDKANTYLNASISYLDESERTDKFNMLSKFIKARSYVALGDYVNALNIYAEIEQNPDNSTIVDYLLPKTDDITTPITGNVISSPIITGFAIEKDIKDWGVSETFCLIGGRCASAFRIWTGYDVKNLNGGSIQKGETIKDAAIRELGEMFKDPNGKTSKLFGQILNNENPADVEYYKLDNGLPIVVLNKEPSTYFLKAMTGGASSVGAYSRDVNLFIINANRLDKSGVNTFPASSIIAHEYVHYLIFKSDVLRNQGALDKIKPFLDLFKSNLIRASKGEYNEKNLYDDERVADELVAYVLQRELLKENPDFSGQAYHNPVFNSLFSGISEEEYNGLAKSIKSIVNDAVLSLPSSKAKTISTGKLTSTSTGIIKTGSIVPALSFQSMSNLMQIDGSLRGAGHALVGSVSDSRKTTLTSIDSNTLSDLANKPFSNQLNFYNFNPPKFSFDSKNLPSIPNSHNQQDYYEINNMPVNTQPTAGDIANSFPSSSSTPMLSDPNRVDLPGGLSYYNAPTSAPSFAMQAFSSSLVGFGSNNYRPTDFGPSPLFGHPNIGSSWTGGSGGYASPPSDNGGSMSGEDNMNDNSWGRGTISLSEGNSVPRPVYTNELRITNPVYDAEGVITGYRTDYYITASYTAPSGGIPIQVTIGGSSDSSSSGGDSGGGDGGGD